MTVALLLLLFPSANTAVHGAGPEKSAETDDQSTKSNSDTIPVLSQQLHQYASRTVFTVQTGSFMNYDDAQNQFDFIVQGLPEKDLDYLRIEKIGAYYSVRIGIFEDKKSADTMLREMKSMVPAALKLKAYIKDDRITKMYKGASSDETRTIEQKVLTNAKTRKTGLRRNYKSAQQSVPEMYTIQTGSFLNYDDAQKKYDAMVQGSNTRDLAYDLSYLRIEKIGAYYSVRIGQFKNQDVADSLLQAMKTRYPDAVMLTDNIQDDRIIKLYSSNHSISPP